MFGTYYNHQQMRRFILAFGQLFDNLQVRRTDAAGKEVQRIVVPIEYANKERWFTRLAQDPEFLRGIGTVTPRMAYSINQVAYDGTRKLNSLNTLTYLQSDTSHLARMYAGVPYTLTFELSMLSKIQQDGLQVLEQILPYFTPDLTFEIRTIPELAIMDQVPLTLLSLSESDTFDGDFEHRRQIIWNLTFAMKVYFYGPVRQNRTIFEVIVDMHGDQYASEYRAAVMALNPIRYWRLGAPNTDGNVALSEVLPYDDGNGHIINTNGFWSTSTSGIKVGVPGALLYDPDTAMHTFPGGSGMQMSDFATSGVSSAEASNVWTFEVWFNLQSYSGNAHAVWGITNLPLHPFWSGVKMMLIADAHQTEGGTGKFIQRFWWVTGGSSSPEPPGTVLTNELVGTTTWELNTWYHLVVQFNRNSGLRSLYVNGVLDTFDTDLSIFTQPDDQGLVGAVSGFSYTSDAILDEMVVYNTDLDAGALALNHYQLGRQLLSNDLDTMTDTTAFTPKVIIDVAALPQQQPASDTPQVSTTITEDP